MKLIQIFEAVNKQSVKDALAALEQARSVKYWMEPEFKTESYKYPQKGKPNSFFETTSKGTKMGGGSWSSDDLIAYDNKGKIVGVLSMSNQGDDKGAFKISVREDAKRKGWGSKLLDKAEQSGIDIVGSIKVNSFSSSGRDLLRSWLTKKL